MAHETHKSKIVNLSLGYPLGSICNSVTSQSWFMPELLPGMAGLVCTTWIVSTITVLQRLKFKKPSGGGPSSSSLDRHLPVAAIPQILACIVHVM